MATPSSKFTSHPVQAPWWAELVASVHQAREVTNASGAAVALIGEKPGEIACYARSGTMAPEPGITLLAEDSLTAQSIRSGKQLHSHDTQTDTRICFSAAAALAARSLVITPIQAGMHVKGVLAVFSDKANAFSSLHLAQLKTTAEKISRILLDEYTAEKEQNPVQLPKKEPDVPFDASKPKPPHSMRLPLSGKEASKELAAERQIGQPIVQSVEQASGVSAATVHHFATFDAVAGPKKDPAGIPLILIIAIALLVIVGSATWAYLRRTKPSPTSITSSLHSPNPQNYAAIPPVRTNSANLTKSAANDLS